MSSLTGSAAGDWILEITDDANGDDGTLYGWTLAILDLNGGIITWSPSTGLSNSTIANPMASPTATTDYVITVVDSLGCSNTDTITIVVNPVPTVNLGTNTAICDTTTLLLDAGNPGANYLWQDNSTSQTYLVDGAVAGVGSHDYWVDITNMYGCVGTDTITVDVTACSGINDPEAQLLIYPNPTTDYFTIDFSMLEYGKYNVEMFNINGQVVMGRQVEYNGNTVTLDVNNVPSGIYTIRVIGSDDTFTGTLRIE